MSQQAQALHLKEEESTDSPEQSDVDDISSLTEVLKIKVPSPVKSTRPQRSRSKVSRHRVDINLDSFADYSSKFGEAEASQLNIVNTFVDTCEELFPGLKEKDYSQEIGVQDALLAGINSKNILSIQPGEPPVSLCTTEYQHSLRRKLRFVFVNNYLDIRPRDEGAVDEFVRTLLLALKFDLEPFDLRCQPPLYLEIGEFNYAALTDFGARVDLDNLLAVVEDKHAKTGTYQKGRLQLACAMIASVQHRWSGDTTVDAYDAYGVLVIADQFCFARASVTRNYLESLRDQVVPREPLKVSWTPAPMKKAYVNPQTARMVDGLRYGVEDERAHIVKTLVHIRMLMKTMLIKHE